MSTLGKSAGGDGDECTRRSAAYGPHWTLVFGVPGSGKSTLVAPLHEALAGTGALVLDWDVLMADAARLRGGRRVEDDPSAWPAYEHMIESVMHSARLCRVVLLAPCTPAELRGRLSFHRVFLLDCNASEREARLVQRNHPADDIQEALRDAESYLRVAEAGEAQRISTSSGTPQQSARELASALLEDYGML
eukprot:TRINITY_DN21477_c0_g1_i1.p1 TRINITY_DN21477_c0_g1~~TRINITY_DN21477_c0_g1_i1.p1  ORF type:complete len:192 (+),score=56.20 TRINITY_DN21477_c0_g1_i1:132-707(+)